MLVAAPWLDQALVWCGWLGGAMALLGVGRMRGWWGECWTVAAAIAAIGIAFHWTPKVLSYAMDTDVSVGLAVAAPIVAWDALRLALPLLVVARVAPDPLRAWLPAGLLAVGVEAVAPAVFPWKLGYSQAAWPWLVQTADLFGPEITTLVFYAHAGLVAWMVQMATVGPRRAIARLPAPPSVVFAAGLCFFNAVYGWWSIDHWSRKAAAAPSIRIALVQANPTDAGGLDALRSITAGIGAGPSSGPDLACWPESSGGCYDQRLQSLADPAEVLDCSRPPHAGLRPVDETTCPLLFGGRFYEGHRDRPTALYQSAILMGTDLTILGRYHKRHLMPFGEYVPGAGWLPDIERYFPMQEDFTAGTRANVLELAEARLGVLLCYEDMISSAARSLVGHGANLLVSLINGSAFTEPLTLRQHRLLAQLRAVECRRALLRCAATGETCVITPWGSVTERIPLHDRAGVMTEVPLLTVSTPYVASGRLLPLLTLVAFTAGWFWPFLRRSFSATIPIIPAFGPRSPATSGDTGRGHA
jgi:apolipoprotein N-acyltransferase